MYYYARILIIYFNASCKYSKINDRYFFLINQNHDLCFLTNIKLYSGVDIYNNKLALIFSNDTTIAIINIKITIKYLLATSLIYRV
jgi:hypothetical protein